ncbi:MAG: DUF1080 domain-containing protein [Anaerolineae bacterium]|jgi:hypothetical protein|nr:DUF1080 domain-containing protein [Anaerolineae bacterium]
MSKSVKTLLIVLAVSVFAVGIVAGLAMSWYSSAVPDRPPSTPRPEANLPWYDDFSDSASGWHTEVGTGAEVGYHDGVLRILVQEANLLAWAFGGHEFSDFRLSVDATQVTGPNDNEYGVLVRIQDRGHLYRFSISGDGYYQVTKHTDEGWQLMTAEWVASDAIYAGAATNRLEVVCQGSTMTFFVNGQQLAQVEDVDYRNGDIGLYAGAFYEPGVEIHFDNLSITEP